ncbi:response regulator transcription factor [Robertmurraya korlensis]|uniref:response regulator n=1 Tax=Robertmurraya korlensis TaxID=519977 RepID=UPI00203AF73B|nr:response regulator transcription factor [Robertmurraya korlensis]MCM3603135.1 response regulator transcription factor [Robertmurraya korlensis]
MDNIRLLIVEDDQVWMKCISEYIEQEEDILVVKKASTEEDALQISELDVDVVLLDLSLSEDEEDLGGLRIANQLYEQGIKKIIMLTSWDEPEIILEAFDNGATNYINKSSYRDIPKAIREAYYDKISIHSDVSSVLLKELKLERKTRVLTPTEREVFKLKEEGLNKVQIAEKLFKSVETIKKQLQMIKKKMNNI